jgi:hypothetical protein
MNASAIREVMHRNGPFSLKAADGTEYEVVHSDFISIGEGEEGLVVVHTKRGLAILDLFNITAIEVPETSDAGTEG